MAELRRAAHFKVNPVESASELSKPPSHMRTSARSNETGAQEEPMGGASGSTDFRELLLLFLKAFRAFGMFLKVCRAFERQNS